MQKSVEVGEHRLTLEDVQEVAVQGRSVGLSAGAQQQVQQTRALVERKAHEDIPVYGVNTGFGSLAEIKIPSHEVEALQRNLILSHAAGVGRSLPRAATRAMMLLRAQTLAQGFSGVRLEVVNHLLAMLNGGVHPCVPEKGSVGASGDLAPLAHLTLGMLGEGRVEYEGNEVPAAVALQLAGLKPLQLQAKEGLSLVNGTQGMAALGSLAQLQAEALADLADITGALTVEGFNGHPSAFDPRIVALRPHPGAIRAAERLRGLLDGSSVHAGVHTKVQDPYSLRCMPQVHGASRDALAACRRTLEVEINSVTDNPLVFAHEAHILSGGNFHGQPLALSLDYAAMAVAELANIAERRIEQLLNPSLSGLPAFLVEKSGIHSGYMIAQLTAAALVNENKVLCTPASVDSIPGNANREDHVSMGMTSARKFAEVVKNAEYVLGIEWLCAAQAVDLRKPRGLGAGTAEAHALLRAQVPLWTEDRYLAEDIEKAAALVRGHSWRGIQRLG